MIVIQFVGEQQFFNLCGTCRSPTSETCTPGHTHTHTAGQRSRSFFVFPRGERTLFRRGTGIGLWLKWPFKPHQDCASFDCPRAPAPSPGSNTFDTDALRRFFFIFLTRIGYYRLAASMKRIRGVGPAIARRFKSRGGTSTSTATPVATDTAAGAGGSGKLNFPSKPHRCRGHPRSSTT